MSSSCSNPESGGGKREKSKHKLEQGCFDPFAFLCSDYIWGRPMIKKDAAC